MKLANLVTAAVFAVFLAAPLGSLAVMGLDPAAEKAVSVVELTSAKLLMPDDRYRNDLSRRLVTNSPIGMDAIRVKNTMDFKVFGFVNTLQAISGEGGWLFYKPGFQNGACLSDRDISVGLARIEAMRALAGAVGTDFRVSVSPDKEVVYPERLGPAAEAAAGCKIRSSRRWRELAEASGSSVIDHLKVLGHRYTDDLLYFKTDTHWNELGKILSISQIAKIYLGEDLSAPSAPSSVVFRETDITKNILRVSYQEDYQSYRGFMSELDKISGDRLPSTLIVHDSFYGSAVPFLRGVFLNPKFLSFRATDFDAQVKAAFAERPGYVLVNSVERELFPRVLGRQISWARGVGAAILDVNASAARECAVSDAGKDSLRLKNMTELKAGDFEAGIDPQIYIKLPDQGRPCVRISFETTVRQKGSVFLPIQKPANQNGAYFEGFSLPLTDAPGPRDFGIILPEDFKGTVLRIDPIGANGRVSKLTIQTGSLPPLATAASQ
ncbi:hypothetical protein [Mesorhizobium sp. J428]|uniref:alginate O-acetyltransferase AlgX-related protein n=1 Tax=Mesorhizobium sp. J428 TaxID=2898440 RepID=UPI0021517F5B|nr:hypothetical protein [Mesorhizobium sp. J428]MCR5855504.1 hypothetical protein [Mesorhizobium sp. J428]